MTLLNMANNRKFIIFAITTAVAIAMPVIDKPLERVGIEVTQDEIVNFIALALGVGTTGVAASAVSKQHSRKAADVARQAGADPETVAQIADPKRKPPAAPAAPAPAPTKATVHTDTYTEPVRNAQTSVTSQTPGPSLAAERAAHGWSGPAKEYEVGPRNPPSACKSRKNKIPDFPILAEGRGPFRTNLGQVQTPEGKKDPGFVFGTPALFVQSRYLVKTSMQGELTDPDGNRIRIKQSLVDYEDEGKLCFRLIKTGVVPEEPLPRGKYNLYVEEDIDSGDPTRNKQDYPFWIV